MTTRDYVLTAITDLNMSAAALARGAGVSYDVVNKLKQREDSDTNAANGAKIKAFVSAAMGNPEAPQVAGQTVLDKLSQLKPEDYETVEALVDNFLSRSLGGDQ